MVELKKKNTFSDSEKADTFVRKLLIWNKTSNRNYLLWRRTKDPYTILVAEMMLQKTTVKQVEGIIDVFLTRFPSPLELAKARTQEIESIIRPLGLEHIRASRYSELSRAIQDKYEGKIPNAECELLGLPGVGQYIANAVLCIAFRKEVPLVDTNIVRILERVFNIKSKSKRARTDKKIWDYVHFITPPKKSRELNLALLDHGALICTAKNPKHNQCPVRDLCTSFMERKI
jgi:A/G-specific adenine glycosylase